MVGGMARRLSWLESAPGLWLVNTLDGQSLDLEVWSWWEASTLWSRSGDRAAVFGTRVPSVSTAIRELTRRRETHERELIARTVELSRDRPAVTPWPPGLLWIRHLDHSPDLRHIAFHRDGMIEVYELDGWTQVARVPTEGGDDESLLVARFVGDQRLLAFVGTGGTSCQRVDLRLAGAREVQTEEITGVAVDEIAAIDGASGRVLVIHREPSAANLDCECTRSWRLYDSALGTLLGKVAVDPSALNTEAAFLSDGHAVISSSTHSQLALQVLGVDGEHLNRLVLGADGAPRLAGEPRPGLLLVTLVKSQGSTLIELDTGHATDLAAWPLARRRGWPLWDALPRGRAACLMVSPDGSTLLELDPDTLQLTPLLGAGAAARR